MAYLFNYIFMEGKRTLTVQEELHRLYLENKSQKELLEKIEMAVQKLKKEDRQELESLLNLQRNGNNLLDL